MYYIGIDLGTSACKLLLVDEAGRVLRTVTKAYPLSFPRPGWSEQDPALWWAAVCAGTPELLAGFDAEQVAGIGAGGQMHGLVALDDTGRVLRPAILWNDGRTQKQTDWLNETVGRATLSRCTANIAFAGFTAPKLLWMRENEPELFARIAKILLPKDYINYKLTGAFCTDYSDASGTLLLDVEAHRVTLDGQEVALTATEFRLLEDLMRHAGAVRTREQLLNAVWGYSFEGYARTVDTHVRRLRAKLGEEAAALETVRGVGYRLRG